jgi:hypothetical protein
MRQNSGNTYSLVYVYRNNSNNQITLNTDITLRKRKKRRKSKTYEKLACRPQKNPLPLLICTRDPLLTSCRGRDSRMMSPSGHPTENTQRVHTQVDYRLCRHTTSLLLTLARNYIRRCFGACLCGLDRHTTTILLSRARNDIPRCFGACLCGLDELD